MMTFITFHAGLQFQVLPDLSHCKMLKHFDQEIYSMMSNTIEDAKKEEIDVVGKSSIESNFYYLKY